MNTYSKALAMAATFALATGVTLADGGVGGTDNSMSVWNGESYAAFHANEVGDFYSDTGEVAGTSAAVSDPLPVLAGSPTGTWQPGKPFRDDTA